jgi:hypothetical protein
MAVYFDRAGLRHLRTAAVFAAADPWHGDQLTTFALEAYASGSTKRDGPRPPRPSIYGLRSEIYGWERPLPESLVELWTTAQIAAEMLPYLLAGLRPRPMAADRRPMLHDRFLPFLGPLAGVSGALIATPITALALRSTNPLPYTPSAIIAVAALSVGGLYLVPTLLVRWGLSRRRRQMAWALAELRRLPAPFAAMASDTPSPRNVAATLHARLVRDHPKTRWLCHEGRGELVLGVRDRWIVFVRDNDGVVQVSVSGSGEERARQQVFAIAKTSDFEACFAAIAAAAVWWAGRLTIYRLERGRTYTVIREFTDSAQQTFREGGRMVFTGASFSPYDATHALKFGEASVVLREEHLVVAAFDQYWQAD